MIKDSNKPSPPTGNPVTGAGAGTATAAGGGAPLPWEESESREQPSNPQRPATAPTPPNSPKARQHSPLITAAASKPLLMWVIPALLVVVLAVGAGGWWYLTRHDTQQQLDELRQSVATLSAAAQQSEAETAVLREELRGAHTALTDGLRKISDAFRDDYEALSKTINTLRGRHQRDQDLLLLSEIEYLLQLSRQRLELSGDIGTAGSALEIVQRRLQDAADPGLNELRRLSGEMLAKLHAIPHLDRTELALQLGALAHQMSGLPRKTKILTQPAATTPATPAVTPPQPPPSTDTDTNDWLATTTAFATRSWHNFSAATGAYLKDVVRIQDIEAPPPALLSPDQHYFLSGNLRLLLLGAQQALLGNHPEVTVQNINQCETLLLRYFDDQTPAVRDALAQLRAIGDAVRNKPAYPATDATLEALRRLRAQREQREPQ